MPQQIGVHATNDADPRETASCNYGGLRWSGTELFRLGLGPSGKKERERGTREAQNRASELATGKSDKYSLYECVVVVAVVPNGYETGSSSNKAKKTILNRKDNLYVRSGDRRHGRPSIRSRDRFPLLKPKYSLLLTCWSKQRHSFSPRFLLVHKYRFCVRIYCVHFFQKRSHHY